MKFFNSLRFKLVLIILCIALIPLVSLAYFQLSQFDTTISDSIKVQEDEIANSNADRMNDWIDSKISQLAVLLKAHPEFKEMDKQEIMSVLKVINESDSELETSVIADKDGTAINDNNNQITSIADRDYFQKAKETKAAVVSDVLVSKSTGNKVVSITVPVLDDSSNFIGVIISVASLKAFENNLGNIKVANTGYAFLMSSKGDVIFHPNQDMVGKSYKDFSQNQDKERVFREEILGKDEGFVTYKDDDGKEMVGSYSTVTSTGWRAVVAVPSEEVFAEANASKQLITILLLIVAVLVILISVIMAGFIAIPIKLAANHLNVLANADFTQGISAKFLKRKDEIGLLARSVDTMSSSIRSALHDVIVEARGAKDNVAISSRNLSELASQIEDVSATTEEMSAGMEETAASAEQMSSASVEIESAVESIALKAQNGSVIAEEISKRAQNLKENAVISQSTAHDISHGIDVDTRTSIEQSKAVEKINMLTESILQITSQTNLLALNAAIEAARAGEAGKGFAVVADEIRKLSEDSKNTVNEIQGVTKLVVTSVESLIKSSEKALHFIDQTVINDYKAMVGIGEQYHKDAESIKDLVTDLSATTEELTASIQSMSKAINEVTVSNSEGAEGIQNIAGKASDVMQKSENMTKLMKEMENKSKRLEETVSKFKI